MASGGFWRFDLCGRAFINGLCRDRIRHLFRTDSDWHGAWQCWHFNCRWRGCARRTARKTLIGNGACHQLWIFWPIRAGAGCANHDERTWLAIRHCDFIGNCCLNGGGDAWHAGAGWRCAPARRDHPKCRKRASSSHQQP